MSRTEDDARTGTAAGGASNGRVDASAEHFESDPVEDGTVLPTSNWSVDDDGPTTIDPLLVGSERTSTERPAERGQTQPTGEVPVVEAEPARPSEQPRRAAKRSRPRTSDRPTEQVPTEQLPTEQVPTEQVAAARSSVDGMTTGVVPTQARTTQIVPTPPDEAGRPDPRGWDVDDDLGPWQSHREMVAPVAPTHYPTSYPADDHVTDVEPRRRVVRRTTRILRHVDPWSTFKVGLLFSLVGYLVTMTSGVLLWNVAARTGTLDNVERWFTQFGWETFSLDGSEIFTNAAIGGLFLAVGATGALVMFATIFNLASDAIGGIRLTVLEESRVRQLDDDLYGHVDPSYGIHIDSRDDWDLGD